MKWLVPLAILTSLSGAAPAAPVEPDTLTIPLGQRRLYAHLPPGFTPRPLQKNATTALLELLHGKETFANWSRLITVTAHRLPPEMLSSPDLALKMFGSPRCPLPAPLVVGPEREVRPGLRRQTLAMTCGDTGKSAYADARAGGEQTFIMLFHDDAMAYSLQYAIHGRAFDPAKPPIPPGQAEGLLTRWFPDVTLCERTDPAPECSAGRAIENASEAPRT